MRHITGFHTTRAIHESPLFQEADDSTGSLAPNCPHVQQQINAQLHQFKEAASEVRAGARRDWLLPVSGLQRRIRSCIVDWAPAGPPLVALRLRAGAGRGAAPHGALRQHSR